MDDLIVLRSLAAEVKNNVEQVLSLLHDLGWMINTDKSSLKPEQIKEFLGLLVDTMGEPCFRVPHQKVHMVRHDIHQLLHMAKTSGLVPVQQLAAVAGLCMSLLRAVLPVNLLLHNVYCIIAQ